MGSKSLRSEMGKEARNFANKHFDIKDVIKKHMEIYKDLTY